MMRYFKYLILITTILALISSCSRGEYNLKFTISTPEKTIIDLTSTIYTETQLQDIIELDVDLNEYHDVYPIECVRETVQGYRVSYLGESSFAIINFDEYGKKLYANIYTFSLNRSCFGDLANGDALSSVREFDPNGIYTFLFTGRNDVPKVSYHYTKDGYLLRIEYDSSHNIIQIDEELI